MACIKQNYEKLLLPERITWAPSASFNVYILEKGSVIFFKLCYVIDIWIYHGSYISKSRDNYSTVQWCANNEDLSKTLEVADVVIDIIKRRGSQIRKYTDKVKG